MGKLATALVMLTVIGSAAFAQDAAVFEKKCKTCHSVAGVGGPKADKGGPLDGIGKKHDDAWLRAYLTDPKSQKPDSKMPKLAIAPDEMDSIVKYLLSLK